MTQPPVNLTSAEIERWLKLWDAVQRIGYDLYGFAKLDTWERVKRIPRLDETWVPDPHLSWGRQQVQILAMEQMFFSAQHIAFLLDTLSSQKYYLWGANDETIGTNLFTEQRVSRQVAEIGELVGNEKQLPQFALRRAINQSADDILLLHRIWDFYGSDQPPVIESALDRGNRWAIQAWHALRDLMPCTAPPLTYIRPIAGIRLIPYGSRPLIGFPSSALTTALAHDYLAIPHELGHYLFWRGRNADGKLFFKQIAELRQWQSAPSHIKHWTEEIFADIVGTLIGGPAALLSLQDMMLEKVGHFFVSDDGHYPPPAIRPYVGLKVCKRMGWNTAHCGLEKRWQTMLDTRTTSTQYAAKAGLLDTMRCDLIECADLLLDLLPLEAIRPHIWTTDEDYREDSAEFYREFGEKTPCAITVDDLSIVQQTWSEAVAEILYQQDDQRAAAFAAAGVKNWWRDVLGLATEDADSATPPTTSPHPISRLDWFAILYLGGWGDAGPTGGAPHVT